MALDRIMKQNPCTRTKQAEISRDIQKAITETFAQTEASAFMAFIAELMETYDVMNLSKETGIDRVTLWRFMRGDRLPRLDTFQKILSVLGIKVHSASKKECSTSLNTPTGANNGKASIVTASANKKPTVQAHIRQKRGLHNERHHPGSRQRHKTLPGILAHLQNPLERLRQTDGLLPIVHPD